ncbi:hypothetical protein DSO57_1002691 [Entomophthora muscae]|uniref:Uncharacterized protein n=1 Tax=Entomophthora muscae TaxID=34485 RepID=A0ACC2UID4_9FUNG|nr:hypothetical protein DSO57_1002691 [Entomophthora muscae]
MDYSRETSKRWSGYDRYAIRRSIYSSDSDSGIVASSPSTDSSLNGYSVQPIPSRFQFAPVEGRTEKPAKKRISWLRLGRKRADSSMRILSEVATSKLSRRYDLTTLELGRGVSGSVFLVRRHKDNENYAAKAYVKKPTDGKYSRTKFLAKIANEVVMLAQLHHENVIRTIDIVSNADQIVTIMEFCPVNLFRLVKEKLLSIADIQEFFSQLGAGVAYLHNECSIAHRDLKLENLGVGQDGQLKVLDFGSAIRLPSDTRQSHICPACFNQDTCRGSDFPEFQRPPQKVRGLCGSDPYIAPEIWESVIKGSGSACRCCRVCGYDPLKSDIWSMGVIYIAMHSGKFPWAIAKPSDPDFTLFKAHRRHRLSKFKVSSSSLPMALGMLTLCPQDRLDIDQVMAHSRN